MQPWKAIASRVNDRFSRTALQLAIFLRKPIDQIIYGQIVATNSCNMNTIVAALRVKNDKRPIVQGASKHE